VNFAELFSLQARALYIWGAFGAFALVLMLEVLLLRARLKRAADELRRQPMGDKQPAPSDKGMNP